jgi:hypothetical protein
MNKLNKVVVPVLGGLLTLSGLVFAATTAAPTVLTVDCAKKADDARCKKLPSSDAGSIGDGPSFYQGGFSDAITGGFATADAVYVSVSYGDENGAVFKVDLATGNRTLISGKLNDNDSRGKGLRFKGSASSASDDASAYTLGRANDLRLLPNGNLVVVGSGRAKLVEVDVKSGDRKLLFASELAPEMHPGGLREKESLKLDDLCPNSGYGPNAIPSNFALAALPGGEVVLAQEQNPRATGSGFWQIKGGKCTALSMYKDGEDSAGSGYKSPGNIVTSMIYVNNLVYALSGFGGDGYLISLDPKTGERRAVSHRDRVKSKNVGAGEDGLGGYGLAYNNLGFFTSKSERSGFGIVRVDPKTGERSKVIAKTGPLSKNVSDDVQPLFTIPGSDLLIVGMERGLFVLDVKTGNSSTLSF